MSDEITNICDDIMLFLKNFIFLGFESDVISDDGQT